MSCCPGIRCKNTGSGYVKPDGDGAKELDNRMKDMLMARQAMDAAIWNRSDAKAQPEPAQAQRAKDININNNKK
jgi:hypothetical protein